MLLMHCSSRVKSWKKIKKDQQRTTKIKPFLNKYSWEEINSQRWLQNKSRKRM